MTDTPFDFAVGKVMALEGGFSNEQGDPGGRTMFGISEAAHPEAWRNGPPTESVARDIYRTCYWTPTGCDFLPTPLAFVVFDMAVNSGVGAAVKTLQGLVGIPQDGRMGPVTISAIRKFADHLAAGAYLDARATFYHILVTQNPGEQKFLTGWLNRLNSLRGDLAQIT